MFCFLVAVFSNVAGTLNDNVTVVCHGFNLAASPFITIFKINTQVKTQINISSTGVIFVTSLLENRLTVKRVMRARSVSVHVTFHPLLCQDQGSYRCEIEVGGHLASADGNVSLQGNAIVSCFCYSLLMAMLVYILFLPDLLARPTLIIMIDISTLVA